MGDVIQMPRQTANSCSYEQLASDGDLFAPGGFLAAVNAVHISGAHLARAIETIRHIQIRSQSDIAEHGRLLDALARMHRMGDYGGAALHARAIALDRWCNEFDPIGETDVDGFYAAGGSAPLIEMEGGLGFEPEGFAAEIEKWSKIFA